jgi:hypothetical protein
MVAVKTLKALGDRGHEVVVVNADFPDRAHFNKINHTGVTMIPYDFPWSR